MTPQRLYRSLAALAAATVILGCSSADRESGVAPNLRPDTAEAAAVVDVADPIIDGVAPIEIIGPGTTVSEVAPEFAWTAVDGAITYRLVVLGPDGPVWAWQGPATSTRLGGLTADAGAAFPAPELAVGTTWSVAALDLDGNVVAVSARRPIEGD